MLRYNISMDLCSDYSNMVKFWIESRGIQTNKTGWDLWYDFFNLQKKTIIAKKRKVHFSREFCCPPHVQSGLELLIKKFEAGESVEPHLSTKATNPSEFDELLYDWGIYHFHLGAVDPGTGRVKRTGPILFARIDNDNVYCINVYSHGKDIPPPWCKQEMIRIIHQNWPDIIKWWRLPGVSHVTQKLTDQEYGQIRKSHVNTAIEVEDGVVYFPPGQGMSSSGHSAELVRFCDKIWNTLKKAELYIKTHIRDFVSKIPSETGTLRYSQQLYFKLWHEGNEFYVVDVGSHIALIQVKLP